MEVDQLSINQGQRRRYQDTRTQLQEALGAREALGHQLSEIARLTREAARYPGRNSDANVLAYNTAVDALVNHVILINENIPPMDQFMREFFNASSHCRALMRDRQELRRLRNQIGHQRNVAAHPNIIIEAGRAAYNITGTRTTTVMADLTRVINLYDSYGSRGRVLPPRQRHDAFDHMP